VSERIAADLRTAAFEHLLQLSLDYFGGKRTGDLMSRIGSETDRISVFLSLHAPRLRDRRADDRHDLRHPVLDQPLAGAGDAAAAALHRVDDPRRARPLRTGFEKIDRVWGDVTSVLADTIPGIRVVKAFAQERREADRFRQANAYNLKVNDRLNKTWSLFTPSVSLLTEIGLLVVWGFGIWQVARGRITVGVLTAFIAYIGRFYTRLDSMSRIVSVTQKAAAGAKRIFDILDHVSNVPEPAHPVKVEKVQGRIEMKGLGFRYGSRAVIRDLDLVIEPGEMIGLVGHSGSGKSTLVNLICRFYDVSDGAIRSTAPTSGASAWPTTGATSAWCCRSRSCSSAPSPRTSPTASRTRRGPRSWPRRAPRMRTSSSCACRWATTRWWANGARACRAASASASRSPRAADRPAHPDPRRGHLQRRHRDREGNPEGARQPGAGRDHDRHRAPPVDPAQGRPAGGDGPRPRWSRSGPHDELIAKQGAYWRLYEAQRARSRTTAAGATTSQLAAPAACRPSGGAMTMIQLERNPFGRWC
jgi:energy-coupling factor transporter ATP-binding protein EcfA2